MTRTARRSRRLVIALLFVAACGAAAGAEEAARKPARPPGGLLPGASSKEPVSIDAGKLDYFDKESRLVYSGAVVAKQGDSTLRASVLTIFLDRDAKKTDDESPGAGVASGSSIRRMEAQGPVTVISKDEVGTGDSGSYDKLANKVTLTGNVTLTQATNIIKGDKLVYDMTSGQAQVTGGRVSSVFTPGSGSTGADGAKKRKATEPPAKPKTAAEP